MAASEPEVEQRITELEIRIRELADEIGMLRGDGGIAGPFNGHIDMAGYRVINAEQSNDQTDYVTRDELSSYVETNGFAIEVITGETGTSLTMSSSPVSIVLFRNGAILEEGASGRLGYTWTSETDAITLTRSAKATDNFVVLKVNPGAI